MKYTFAIIFLLVLATPIVMRWAISRSRLSEKPPAGAMELVIMTPHVEPIRREFEEAFNAWHQARYGQPVDINYQSFGAADITQNLRARNELFKKTGSYDIDLVWGGGDSTFDRDFKPFLEGLALNPQLIRQVFPQPTLAGLRLYDSSNPPLWYGTALSSFGIAFNRDIVKHLGLSPPTTWRDLADARYSGWILLADPTKSSSARTAFMVIVERAMADAKLAGRSEDTGWAEGMGLVRLIASNARNFNDGSNALPALVSSGDVAAAMMIDFYARAQIQAVGDERMGYVEPVNATIINPDPIGLIKGAPHRELAQQFVEFVLSEQGQRLFELKPGTHGGPKQTALRRLPVRQSVYADMTGFSDPVDPFKAASSFNTSRARTQTFDIIGDLIQASCIDTLEELRAARAAAEASAHPQRYVAVLGRFPFDQPEALHRAAIYKKASPLDRLRIVREWTQQFRDEYREIQMMAGKDTNR